MCQLNDEGEEWSSMILILYYFLIPSRIHSYNKTLPVPFRVSSKASSTYICVRLQGLLLFISGTAMIKVNHYFSWARFAPSFFLSGFCQFIFLTFEDIFFLTNNFLSPATERGFFAIRYSWSCHSLLAAGRWNRCQHTHITWFASPVPGRCTPLFRKTSYSLSIVQFLLCMPYRRPCMPWDVRWAFWPLQQWLSSYCRTRAIFAWTLSEGPGPCVLPPRSFR